MILKPRKEIETLNYAIIAIDFIVAKFLIFLIIFFGPILLAAGSRRGRHYESSNNLLSSLYDQSNGFFETWLIISLCIGFSISTLIIIRKINKKHLIKIELIDGKLYLHFINLKNISFVKEIDLRPNNIRFRIVKSTPNSFPYIEVIQCSSGFTIVSTKSSKYWKYKYEYRKLIKFREVLDRLGALKK